ncbi:MAG: penicillin-binding transpeptidase domain-containing protein [Enterobacterales bacterium]|nr:penicillin-binding transpeptidase domain-containing protein [Enterobacterales bacterium]
MLQQGEIIPSQLVPDLPTQIGGYAPQNYDREFRGAVSTSEALAQSLNIPAVRLVRQFGVDRFYDFLTGLGLTSLHRSPQQYGLPIILGGAEISLWEIAAAYANLATISQNPQQKYYAKVSLLKDQNKSHGKATEIGAGAAWLTLKALLEVKRPGSDRFWKNFLSSQKIAWKTGTSYGLKDGWAIGITPKFTVAVWIGNADGHGVPGLTGASAAAPLMFSIFNLLPKSSWFETPYQDLKQVVVCADDGFMSNGRCLEKTELIPLKSHFSQLTPFHFQLHLDKETGLRVNSRCEKVRNMKSVNQFVLPPSIEFYYQRAHSKYQAIPEYRADCQSQSSSSGSPMAFIYPQKGTKVYVPIDLDGKPSQVIFEAVHRRHDAVIYWHLDDQYITASKQFHQLAIDLDPGWHRITLVDEKGFRLTQNFKVLNPK